MVFFLQNELSIENINVKTHQYILQDPTDLSGVAVSYLAGEGQNYSNLRGALLCPLDTKLEKTRHLHLKRGRQG